MATRDKMYKASPKMERGEDGAMEVVKKEKTEGGHKGKEKKDMEANSMDMAHRHGHERREMHHRHQAEANDMHHKHEVEHMTHEEKYGMKGKEEMHARHEEEHKALHKKHQAEKKALHKKHEDEITGGAKINKVEKDEQE